VIYLLCRVGIRVVILNFLLFKDTGRRLGLDNSIEQRVPSSFVLVLVRLFGYVFLELLLILVECEQELFCHLVRLLVLLFYVLLVLSLSLF